MMKNIHVIIDINSLIVLYMYIYIIFFELSIIIPISIHEILKLYRDDMGKDWANRSSLYLIFSQSTNKEIDMIRMLINSSQDIPVALTNCGYSQYG